LICAFARCGWTATSTSASSYSSRACCNRGLLPAFVSFQCSTYRGCSWAHRVGRSRAVVLSLDRDNGFLTKSGSLLRAALIARSAPRAVGVRLGPATIRFRVGLFVVIGELLEVA